MMGKQSKPTPPPTQKPPTQKPRNPNPTQKPLSRESQTDMYGISRKSADRDTGQQGWIVHLSRGGRMIQTSFSDSTYGSEAASLYVARAYRDAVLEIVPPLTRVEMRQIQRKTAGSTAPDDAPRMAGVTYTKAGPGRSARWTARIELPADDDHPTLPAKGAKRARRSVTRSFSVGKLGYDAAKAAAEEARLDMLANLQDGDDPALMTQAAQRLHKRLGRKAE